MANQSPDHYPQTPHAINQAMLRRHLASRGLARATIQTTERRLGYAIKRGLDLTKPLKQAGDDYLVLRYKAKASARVNDVRLLNHLAAAHGSKHRWPLPKTPLLRRHPYTTQERRRLLTLDGIDGALIRFSLSTGLRLETLWLMQAEDVTPEGYYVTASKNQQRSWLPWADPASYGTFAAYLPERGPAWQTGNRRLATAASLASVIARAGKRVGVTASCQRSRHTFADALVMAGYPTHLIQAYLIHKSIRTTMEYIHLTPWAFQHAIKTAPLNLLEGFGAKTRRPYTQQLLSVTA